MKVKFAELKEVGVEVSGKKQALDGAKGLWGPIPDATSLSNNFW